MEWLMDGGACTAKLAADPQWAPPQHYFYLTKTASGPTTLVDGDITIAAHVT
jgi:hypothetical protein